MPPEFAIKMERIKGDQTVIEVDTKKATYQGLAWQTLGDFGKRKWENLLVLSRPTERVKVIYA
jgi:hypothetical protein